MSLFQVAYLSFGDLEQNRYYSSFASFTLLINHSGEGGSKLFQCHARQMKINQGLISLED